MFKAFVSVFIIICSLQTLHAQDLALDFYLQENAFGLQKGYSIKLHTNKLLSAGVFYQSSEKIALEYKENNYSFKGIDFGLQVQQCHKLSLHLNLKVGLVDNSFLIATPELQTNYKVWSFLDVAATAGYRVGHAAIGIKTVLYPFK